MMNREQIQLKYQQLWHEYLSPENARLLHEFYTVEPSATGYALIIDMDRRCSTVRRIHDLSFGHDLGLAESAVEVCSHNALAGRYQELQQMAREGRRILLRDDVLIYGRTVGQVWKFLTDVCGFSPEQIDINIFGYCNFSKKCLQPEMLPRILPVRLLNKQAWRRMSTEIIKLVSNSGLPHAAFVVSYAGYFENMNGEELKKTVPDIFSLFFTEDQAFKIIWTPSSSGCPHQLDTLIAETCVRGNYSKLTKRFSLIPFVFTKSIRRDNLSTLLTEIAEYLPNNFTVIRKSLTSLYPSDFPCDDSVLSIFEEYQLRLLNCILSVWMGALFCRKYFNNFNLEVDTSIICDSFSRNTALEIMQLDKFVRDNLKDRCENQSASFSDCLLESFYGSNQEIDNAVARLKEISDEKIDVQWLWPKYYFLSGDNDNAQANLCQPRAIGLPMSCVNSYFPSDKVKRSTALAYLVDALDGGTATLKYRSVDNFCEAFNTAGELSFKYFLTRYGGHIRKLLAIHNHVWQEQNVESMTNLEEIRRKQGKRMKAFVDELSGQEKEDLSLFLEKYKDEIISWDINYSQS